jgi:hypothetical protein
MTGQVIVIADLEDGCPAAVGWVAYFDHLTLPLTGQELADAQATLAGWDDPDSPQASSATAGAAPPRSPGSAPWSTRPPASPAERTAPDE